MSQRARDGLMLAPAVLALVAVTWLSFDRYGSREEPSPSPSPTAAEPFRSPTASPAATTPAAEPTPLLGQPANVAELILEMAGLDISYYSCRGEWRVHGPIVTQAWEDGAFTTETMIECSNLSEPTKEAFSDEGAYFVVEHAHDAETGRRYVTYIGVGP